MYIFIHVLCDRFAHRQQTTTVKKKREETCLYVFIRPEPPELLDDYPCLDGVFVLRQQPSVRCAGWSIGRSIECCLRLVVASLTVRKLFGTARVTNIYYTKSFDANFIKQSHLCIGLVPTWKRKHPRHNYWLN